MALAHIRDATLPTSSLAVADIRDATLPTSSLALAHIGDATLPTSSLALADIRDATGEIQRTDRLHGSKVSVHTGGIDQAWKDLKKNVPNSIATRKDGAPNPLLWQYATQWQWRWENSACANLSRLTAETLRANMQ